MYPANLTRAETTTRAGLVKAHSYRVLINVTGLDAEGKPFADVILPLQK